MNILHNVVDGANKMEGTRENSTMQNGMKQKYYPRSNRLHKEQTQKLSGSNEWRTESCKAKVSTRLMIHSLLNNAMCQRDMHIGDLIVCELDCSFLMVTSYGDGSHFDALTA